MRRNFVFTTKRYEEEAEKFSASGEIQKVRDKAERDPNYEPKKYDSFSGNYYKVRHENLRIVLSGKDVVIDGLNVRIYVALRFLKKDGNEYKKFQFSMTSADERDRISGLSSLDWNVYINQVRESMKKTEIIEVKPDLKVEEFNFISSSMRINHSLFDETIYETKEWIKDVQGVDFSDFSNAASEIENFIYENVGEATEWRFIEFKDNAIIIYHHDKDWILCRIVKRREDSDYSEFMRSEPIDFHRGYPYKFLDDKDVWRIMELDKKSNMVLSKQQVGIVSGDIEYPLFLTGRAGSGKSTVLQYIFAEIVLRYLITIKQIGGDLKYPAYLSYSSNLIEDAKKLCATLFEKNNVYKDELKKSHLQYKSDIAPIMDEMFFVFSNLLRKCIDSKKPGESNILFPVGEKYISFPIFNAKWERKFGKIRDAAKKYGPSISWHVIRTYIKGWNSEKFMTPEEYANIGEKNQSVSLETYKLIYTNVWENWYSTLEGIWDDQDIVRYCLENDLVDERFSAIFCDESQDFTRVELDFILKLSSFSYRNIQNLEDVKRIPFVFAGDEFQTLNPTGFSWESLRSYFTEKLCAFTGLEDRINELSIPDPIELSENFRSTRQVVKLANRVQLLRAARFREYSKPQKPHFSQDGNPIYCVSPSDKFNFEKLKEKQVILIIPAADGESVKDYIDNTPLKGLIEFDKDGVPVDITILNPTQAKGLEYPNVAVFGFSNQGQYSALSMNELLTWFLNDKESTINDIELKYQVSNAYVAVTRAGSNLYIIDDFNKESFWSFAFNHEDPEIEKRIKSLQEQMFSSLPESQQRNWSEDELGWIDYVPDLDITDENLSYLHSEEHKNDLENRAEALHDPTLMRRAACIHKGIGNKEDEARCKAKAFIFEENYLEAAEWFEKAKLFDDAVECYWNELNRTTSNITIVKKIAQLKDFTHNPKLKLCETCVKPTIRDFKIALDDTINVLKDEPLELSKNRAWQYVLNMILHELLKKKLGSNSDMPVIVASCEELKKSYINIDMLNLARLSYNVGAISEAVKIWETMDKAIRPEDYYKAKLKELSYPATLEYYEGTKDIKWKEKLLAEYRKAPDVKLTDSQKRILCGVIRSLSDTQSEFNKFLPFMLRSAYNIETSKSVVGEAEKNGLQLNKQVLYALIEARYSDLQQWERPTVNYVDQEAGLLFDAIEALKKMRGSEFMDLLERSVKELKVKEFCTINYRKFSRKSVTKLVLMELGHKFEEKGKFIDAMRFYEWARNQSDDQSFKRDMDLRLLVCKERKADIDGDEKLIGEAMADRNRLSIAADASLPLSPSLSIADWDILFEHFIKTSNEIRKEESKPTKTKTEQKTMERSSSRPKKKQTISFDEYSVILFPEKGDVVLKDNEEEYSIRIKGGVFPDNGDFYLDETDEMRIYNTEDDAATPFSFVKYDDYFELRIFEGNAFTGLSIKVQFTEDDGKQS